KLFQLILLLFYRLNPNGADINSNSLLIQLVNGKHSSLSSLLGENSEHSFKLNVSFAGVIGVSVQRNNDNPIELSSEYLGGLAIRANANRSNAIEFDANNKPVNPFLKNIYETNENSQKSVSDNEIAVLVAHGSLTGAQIKANNRTLDSSLIGVNKCLTNNLMATTLASIVTLMVNIYLVTHFKDNDYRRCVGTGLALSSVSSAVQLMVSCVICGSVGRKSENIREVLDAVNGPELTDGEFREVLLFKDIVRNGRTFGFTFGGFFVLNKCALI
ncbi:unnamed protein product, partial [Medioppia subpectinata]